MPKTFGGGTVQCPSWLLVAVVGCFRVSGPVIEQLFRCGIGELVLVDDEHLEDRNVDAIPNSTMRDVREYSFRLGAAWRCSQAMTCAFYY